MMESTGLWDPLWHWTALLSSPGTQQTSTVTPRCSGVKMANLSLINHMTCRTPPHGDLKLFRISLTCTRLKTYLSKTVFSVLMIRSPAAGQLMVNSLLVINLTDLTHFGPYSCTVRNISSDFIVIHSGTTTKDTYTYIYWVSQILPACCVIFLKRSATQTWKRHANVIMYYRENCFFCPQFQSRSFRSESPPDTLLNKLNSSAVYQEKNNLLPSRSLMFFICIFYKITWSLV